MENKIYKLLFEIDNKLTSNTTDIKNLKIQIEKLNNSFLTLINNSSGTIIKKNIELIFLKDGFNLDKEFIKKCFIRNSSIADLELLNEYYKQKDIIFPIKKKGKDFIIL